MPEQMQLREVTAETLREASTVADDGTVQLRIMAPGWSLNGRYYPAEVLRRDGPQVFTEGTHSYIDHASRSDEYDRPERSVRDLAGSLTTTARYDEAGPAGPGLYARATIRPEYQPLVGDLAGDIGVSIVGDGIGEPGERDGQSGTIITAITSAESVDLVTRPAAGGQIIQLIESVRGEPVREAAHGMTANELRDALDSALTDRFADPPPYAWVRDYAEDWVVYEHGSDTYRLGYTVNDGSVDLGSNPVEVRVVLTYVPVTPEPVIESTPPTREEPAMPITDEEAAQLREAAQTAQTERDEARTEAARYRAAQRLSEESTAVREAVEGVDVPGQFESATELIREHASARVQVVRDSDGVIVRDALTESARRAVADEVEALTRVTESLGVGPRGAGGGGDPAVPSKAEDYQEHYGLSESAAKILARK